MIRKLIVHDGRAERELLLSGRLVIGRDPSCHVSEPDPLMSRRHAEIVTGPRGTSIRDLGSRNGLLVNGEKTREQILLPGDVVQVGNLQLRYLEEEASQDSRHWTPEPTPLPGRRDRAATPPDAVIRASTPPLRGRAGFEQAVQARPAPDGDATMVGVSAVPRATAVDQTPDTGNATIASSQNTLSEAVARLAGLAQPRAPRTMTGARLIADAELTIVDATPECAALLGVPDEPLIGNSLTDVFLQGVRRAYADVGGALTFTIARDDEGAIAVTLSLTSTSGHDR